MLTAKRSPAMQRTAWIGGVAAGVVASGVGYFLLARTTDDGTAAGFLTGGLAVVALALLARWRSTRRGASASTADRLGGGAPDERDRRVLESTFAVGGVVALLASSVASAAALMGVDALVLLTALPMLLLATMVVAFVVTNRRT